MEDFVPKEIMFEFMTWFVHNQRKTLKYSDNINAADFASNLMVILCAKPAFEKSKISQLFDEFMKEKIAEEDKAAKA